MEMLRHAQGGNFASGYWCGVEDPMLYTSSWDETTCLACLDNGTPYAHTVATRLRKKIARSSVPDIEGEAWDE